MNPMNSMTQMNPNASVTVLSAQGISKSFTDNDLAVSVLKSASIDVQRGAAQNQAKPGTPRTRSGAACLARPHDLSKNMGLRTPVMRQQLSKMKHSSYPGNTL